MFFCGYDALIYSLLINYFMEKIDIVRGILTADFVSLPLPEDDEKLSELSFEELEMDSLDKVEFLIKLERQCNVCISDDDVAKMHNLGDVLAYLS